MKIRKGFVSNSSSTSFVCEICGESESGWDLCLSDSGMVECINGHTFCEGELLEDVPENEKSNEMHKDYPSDVDSKYCPICNFIVFSSFDLSKYLEKLTGISKDEALQEVKRLNPRRKKLYNEEYIAFACTKNEINKGTLIDEIKNKFITYRNFKNFCNGTKDCAFENCTNTAGKDSNYCWRHNEK